MNLSLLARVASGVLLSVSLMSAQSSAPPAPLAENAVVPGEMVIEPPTLINLGFEWFIQGDINRNAIVDVSYR